MLKTINLKKIWQYIDQNILLILSSILLVVIPLYPKLPLFDIIPGYIVRVRAEDFLILFTVLVFLIKIYQKKIKLKTPLNKSIFIYAVIGFLSVLSGIFITKTIPTTPIHLSKSFLHYFRYLEYFSLFFIFYFSIKTKKDLKIIISTLISSYTLVGIYGAGQRYLYWPVYSTMNREFSKGIRLYLTKHARVQSTFGGHYDMAAYLVILLPIIFLLTQYVKTKILKSFLWTIFTLGIWLMVVSASRTSFIASLVGIFITIVLRSLKETNTAVRIKFFFSKSITVAVLFILVFITFGQDINQRLAQSFKNYAFINNSYTFISKKINHQTSIISTNITNITPEIKKPKNGLSTDQAAVIVASDTRPTPIKPSDVFVDVPDKIKVATISASGKTEIIVIEVPRTYSQNALKHGLSLAIRLDTLWPQALRGFYRNPLLGTGYATLTKSQINQFTEADSTDNNFLRTLGETGILGFIVFYGMIVFAIIRAYKISFNKNTKNTLKTTIALGFIGATIGLLINAIFIDVFAASKVALTFWSLTGILFGLENIKKK